VIETRSLGPGLLIAGQVAPDDLGTLRDGGLRTLIDLRPDGEGPDQPASAPMAAAAGASGLDFHYIPVPQDGLPDEAADAVGRALAAAPGPALLYCRSGRRAARIWALAEASRPGGLAPAAILEAVRAAGQSADDLAPRLDARAARRS
jgi:uncharacterized protein (TIGR01244 family)